MARMAASASSRVARCTERRSTWMTQSAATTLGRVPPRTTPALTVTPGQRPLSACSATILWAASSTALRPFSGSTPACAARPGDAQLEVSDALAGADDVAVGAGTLHHERHVHGRGVRTDDGRADGRPDLLVRVGHERDALEGHRRPATGGCAARTGPPAGRPSCPRHPDRSRCRRLIRNGRSATVPGSNTVSMWPTSSRAGPSGSAAAAPAPTDPRTPTTVSPWSTLGMTSTLAPRSRKASATHRPTSSTPALVYEPQSMSTSRWRSAR